MKEYISLKTIIDNTIGDDGVEKDIFAIKKWVEQDNDFINRELPKLLMETLTTKIDIMNKLRNFQDCWVGVATFQCNPEKVSREDEIKMNCYIDRFMGGFLSSDSIPRIKEVMERIDINDVYGCNISFREYMLTNHNVKFKNDTIQFNNDSRISTRPLIPEQECDKNKEVKE